MVACSCASDGDCHIDLVSEDSEVYPGESPDYSGGKGFCESGDIVTECNEDGGGINLPNTTGTGHCVEESEGSSDGSGVEFAGGSWDDETGGGNGGGNC